MNYKQIEKLYTTAGIKDYKFKNIKDLERVLKIDYKVEGFGELTLKDVKLYKDFLTAFYNGWGLEKRMELVPTAIKRVDNYLRFEYLNDNSEMWLHVISNSEWY